jgi:hypothetical protein
MHKAVLLLVLSFWIPSELHAQSAHYLDVPMVGLGFAIRF